MGFGAMTVEGREQRTLRWFNYPPRSEYAAIFVGRIEMERMYILQGKGAYSSTLLSRQQADAVKEFIHLQFGEKAQVKVCPVDVDFEVYQGHTEFEALVSSKASCGA